MIHSDFKVGDVVKVGGRYPYIAKVVRPEDATGRMGVQVVVIGPRISTQDRTVHVDDCQKMEVSA